MRHMRWIWVGVGAAIGYVLGARAGHERYEELARWGRKTANDFGVTPAAGLIVDTARTTAEGVRDAAAAKTQDVLDVGATVISDRLEAVGDSLGAGSQSSI